MQPVEASLNCSSLAKPSVRKPGFAEKRKPNGFARCAPSQQNVAHPLGVIESTDIGRENLKKIVTCSASESLHPLEYVPVLLTRSCSKTGAPDQ